MEFPGLFALGIQNRGREADAYGNQKRVYILPPYLTIELYLLEDSVRE